MPDLLETIEAAQPDAVYWIQSMAVGSAERFYAQDYFACVMTGMPRPAAVEYGVAVLTAEKIRQAINERVR